MSGKNFAQGIGDDLEARQKELWRSAGKRVVCWGKLQPNDYDFRTWAKNASEDLLNAGCAYEYARESYKFRCMLVLDSRTPEERDDILPLIEYKGSSAGHEYLTLSGWETWLRGFSDELIANRSFAELLLGSTAKVNESLAALPGYSQQPKAVEKPGRRILYHRERQPEFYYPGSQVVSVQIFWRHYTNKEIGKEMEKLARTLRPPEEPEPKKTGKWKRSSTECLLDALSAMRLASHFRRRDAIIKFSEIQLGYIGRPDRENVALSNFKKLASKARRFFFKIFPFGENAANAVEF
jgi:hypothetical protein